MNIACPHCAMNSPHVCPDREVWTQAELDEFRAQTRRHFPMVRFAPSSEEMAARFGQRNREDRERGARS